jgi:hypothetical protein
MNFHGGHAESSPWVRISEAVGNAKGKVWAAVAYIGVSGDKVLPLKKGDVLVCDCSKRAVHNGSTTLKGVRSFVEAGCKVYSVEGLHAKVVVLPGRSFVGSMNASHNSATRLHEAVLETTSADASKKAREFVKELAANAAYVDDAFLRKAKKWESRKPPVPRPEIQLPDLPKNLTDCRIVWLDRDEWTDDEEEAFTRGVETAKHQTPLSFKRDSFSWPKKKHDKFPDKSWVIQIIGDVAHPPAQVVHKTSFRHAGSIHLATPKGYNKIKSRQVEDICGTEPESFVAICPSRDGKALRSKFG